MFYDCFMYVNKYSIYLISWFFKWLAIKDNQFAKLNFNELIENSRVFHEF